MLSKPRQSKNIFRAKMVQNSKNVPRTFFRIRWIHFSNAIIHEVFSGGYASNRMIQEDEDMIFPYIVRIYGTGCSCKS